MQCVSNYNQVITSEILQNWSLIRTGRNRQAEKMNVTKTFTGNEPESKPDDNLNIDLIKVPKFFCQQISNRFSQIWKSHLKNSISDLEF